MTPEQHFVPSGINNTTTSKVLDIGILAMFFVSNICCGISLFFWSKSFLLCNMKLFLGTLHSMLLGHYPVTCVVNNLCTLFNAQAFYDLRCPQVIANSIFTSASQSQYHFLCT